MKKSSYMKDEKDCIIVASFVGTTPDLVHALSAVLTRQARQQSRHRLNTGVQCTSCQHVSTRFNLMKQSKKGLVIERSI